MDRFYFEAGSLEVSLAENASEIREAQGLRYRVFVEERGASATPEMHSLKLDIDEFDEICDHILVRDRESRKVVGTYRILRRSRLPAGRKFYTESEYDISKMLAYFKGDIMELGRSCVDKDYRNRSTMQLLWRAIGEYSVKFDIELMFGCASFPGSNAKEHAVQLSYLHHYCLAPEEYRPRTLEHLYVPMNMVDKNSFDAKRVLVSLPPLVKGYIRLGAFVGDGAFEDKNYNTTDVCIALKADQITDKYQNRYVAPTKA